MVVLSLCQALYVYLNIDRWAAHLFLSTISSDPPVHHNKYHQNPNDNDTSITCITFTHYNQWNRRTICGSFLDGNNDQLCRIGITWIADRIGTVLCVYGETSFVAVIVVTALRLARTRHRRNLAKLKRNAIVITSSTDNKVPRSKRNGKMVHWQRI